MTYLIDGHNVARSAPVLFGKASGRDASRPCGALVLAVDRFCAGRSARAVIVFDGDPFGIPFPLSDRGDRVRIVYSGAGRSADDLLRSRIDSGDPDVPETLVTSDAAVAAYGRRAGLPVLSARAFCDFLTAGTARGAKPAATGRRGRAAPPTPSAPPPERNRRLTPAEVDHWLRVFDLEQDGS